MSGGPYITPRALITGARARHAVAAKQAWPLLGDRGAFAAMDVTTVQGAVVTALMTRPMYENSLICASPMTGRSIDASLAALGKSPPAFAGLDLSQPRLMGIVNVTPDSFSDGGQFAAAAAAIAHAIALAEAGADIIDVGGESTRPGAVPVDPTDEQARVIPVVEALASRGLTVSVDTRHAATMAAAIAAGARIINDITALQDAAALKAVAASNVSVILMHMQGEPQSMQQDPRYVWAPGDIFDFLTRRITACVAAGLASERIAVDPGIGFGQTETHAAQVLDHLGLLHGLGCPLVIGVSRKSFIARLSQGEGAAARLPGSLAAGLNAVGQGAQILRVHDVSETKQALTVAQRIGALI